MPKVGSEKLTDFRALLDWTSSTGHLATHPRPQMAPSRVRAGSTCVRKRWRGTAEAKEMAQVAADER